jgi:uncharacterized caspase-like protein
MHLGGRIAGCVLATLFACLLACAPAGAQDAKTLRGVALVIGNGNYEHLAPLPNPGNDADAIEALLSDLGFESVRRTDRDAADLTRDLNRFADEAAEADVAVLYYSGHGIEAGGENYLVPVDADFSALDDAGEKLVPLSALVARLQATVPVTILMLDACRDSPFPPGAMLTAANGVASAVTTSGLAATRGAVSVGPASDASQDESYGTVLAFAAEPGKVAFDGDPGAGSPYAAAIIRHLDAMVGEEFGTVMRLVAEEVYLKTAGKQRPWMNESLRRLLYFGSAPKAASGDARDILTERRQLLLTIAALPSLERTRVERVAASDGIPMDAVYGMLKAMGSNVPEDPAKLEELLSAEAKRFAGILAEREVIVSPDPEIVRLSALADDSEREGLLAKADELRQRAKARFRELMPTLEAQQAALDQRFVEGAAVFERSAGTRRINFDHLGAAQDYAEAFRLVEGRDVRLAWRYKNGELKALRDHGYYKGDNAALEGAIAAGQEALLLAEASGQRDDRATTQNDLGLALTWLGEREIKRDRLEQAVAAFREALNERRRDSNHLAWAETQHNLGFALFRLNEREFGPKLLTESVKAYRAALEERTRERVPLEWAYTQNNLGVSLLNLGASTNDIAMIEEAVAGYHAALEVRKRELVPLDWAQTQNNLGVALRMLGVRQGSVTRLEEAIAAYRASLLERTRERVPLEWARVQTNLGLALANLGMREEDGTARIEEAIAVLRSALEERTRERVPLDWARTMSTLGVVLTWLGQRTEESQPIEQAIAHHRAALKELPREQIPVQWVYSHENLAFALWVLGSQTFSAERLEEAAAAYRATLEERRRGDSLREWADTQMNIARVMRDVGEFTSDPAKYEEAVAAYRAVLEVRTRGDAPGDWAATQKDIGFVLLAVSELTNSTARLEEAVAAFRAVLEVATRDSDPDEWSYAQLNLADALVQLATVTRRKSDAEAAMAAITAAWEADREAGNMESDAYYEGRLAEAKDLLASMD